LNNNAAICSHDSAISMRRLSLRSASLALLLLAATVVASNDTIVEGFTTFFATAACPDGWEQIDVGQGRLIVAVANASLAGVTVNNPLGDQEDRSHTHSVSTTYTIPDRQVAAIADDNTEAAHEGTFSWSTVSQPRGSGYPFTQLPLCRYRGPKSLKSSNDTTPRTGFGTVAYYSTDISACPHGWAAKQDANGRILVPGYAEGGPTSNTASPLASGEDRLHNHTFEIGFTTTDVSFEGIDGCCDSSPAKAGVVSIAGTTSSESSGLPYVQLLTCVNQQSTFDAVMPPGALLFHELKCPPGWSMVELINGRFLVGLPSNGAPGASFGGESLPSLHPANPLHHHTINGTVSLEAAHVLLVSGCCGSGFAGTGDYLVSGPSDAATVDLPYTMLPMCQQTSEVEAIVELLRRRESHNNHRH
jgi:hypothetical protein